MGDANHHWSPVLSHLKGRYEGGIGLDHNLGNFEKIYLSKWKLFEMHFVYMTNQKRELFSKAVLMRKMQLGLTSTYGATC